MFNLDQPQTSAERGKKKKRNWSLTGAQLWAEIFEKLSKTPGTKDHQKLFDSRIFVNEYDCLCYKTDALITKFKTFNFQLIFSIMPK